MSLTQEWYEDRALEEEQYADVTAGRVRLPENPLPVSDEPFRERWLMLDKQWDSSPARPEERDAAVVLGLLLNLRRRERGLSLEQLAAATGTGKYGLMLLEHAALDPEAVDSRDQAALRQVLGAEWLARAAITLSLPGRPLRRLWGATPDVVAHLTAFLDERRATLAVPATQQLQEEERTFLRDLLAELLRAGSAHIDRPASDDTP